MPEDMFYEQNVEAEKKITNYEEKTLVGNKSQGPTGTS